MVKNPLANAGDPRCKRHRRLAFDIWEEEPGRLYSPWGHQDSDMTEHTHTHLQIVTGSLLPFCFGCFFSFFLLPNFSG